MRKRCYLLTLACLMGLTAEPALCADAKQVVPTMKYVHVYADSAGVSHFREEHLDFAPGRTEETSIHALAANGRTTLLRLRVGAVEDWHNAPRAWFLIVLQGASEVTTSDGEVRQFGPGTQNPRPSLGSPNAAQSTLIRPPSGERSASGIRRG